ncbi:hypothetical protein [Aurantiacibacter gilvus]|uniref:Uncharacterized protein n=1 Tax=Aurantiacibacter gilvus TaxID=3139141 RepID=A0ABU9IGJ2_9SPHN
MLSKPCLLAAALALSGAFVPQVATAQFRVPQVRLPSAPPPPRPAPRPAAEEATPQTSGATTTAPVEEERPDARERYREDMGIVLGGLTPPGTAESPEHNRQLDEMIAAHNAAVERLVARDYPGVSAEQWERDLRAKLVTAENRARRTEGTIDWSMERVDRNAGTTPWLAASAYNEILVQDTELHAATRLFPDRVDFAAEKRKTEAALAMLVSREQAAAGFDAAALEAARNVRMPAAVASGPDAEAPFRQAWPTSGIPYRIMRIAVTSGWSDKVEYGRVIGQTRDAAIAAQDPDNPDRCNLYSFTVFRDRSGSVRRDSHSTRRIACENVG